MSWGEMQYFKQCIDELKDALECLLDDFLQIADNACMCSDLGENEKCSYCNAKEVLENMKDI